MQDLFGFIKEFMSKIDLVLTLIINALHDVLKHHLLQKIHNITYCCPSSIKHMLSNKNIASMKIIGTLEVTNHRENQAVRFPVICFPR